MLGWPPVMPCCPHGYHGPGASRAVPVQGSPMVALKCCGPVQLPDALLLPVLSWLRNAACLVNKVMKQLRQRWSVRFVTVGREKGA